MANDSFKIKKGLNIEPNTTPNLSTDGDIGFNSTDSNLEVYTGGSVKKVITNSQTQTLTNKTLTAPTIDVMTLDGQASAPSNPSAGNYKVYVDDTTSKLQILDSSGTVTTVGTSAGGINYITNGDAEAATTGWATYADAAGTSPVDGTGGSATTTFTRTTSSPLRGLGSFLITKDAANRQGEGASYAFTIADADKAKMMQIDFELEVNSGTYVTGDVAVYIVDVTNSTVIQPSGYQVENVGIESRQRLTFQTASNSTSYRLCFHVASTSASAYALKIDTITLGPQVVPLGAPVTDWVSYTPTGGWTGAVTYTGRWRRVGDQAEINVKVAVTGTPTGTNLTLNLPSGLVIDSTKMASAVSGGNTVFGIASMLDTGTRIYDLRVGYNTTTSVSLWNVSQAVTNIDWGNIVTPTSPVTTVSGDTFDAFFSVPIVGWSSSTVVSSSADTRVVAASMNRATNQTGLAPNNSLVKVNFNQVLNSVNTHGGVDTTNFRINISVPGTYKVEAGLFVASTNVLANYYGMALYKNGSSVANLDYKLMTVSTDFILQGVYTLNLVAGDYLEIYLQGVGNNSVSTLTVSASSMTKFTATMLQGPSQIAASEVIAARAYLSANQTGVNTNGTFVKINFNATTLDTHGAWNTSTSRYNVPAAGIYSAETIIYTSGANVLANIYHPNIYVNGTAVQYGAPSTAIASTTTGGYASWQGQLNVGDYIEVYWYGAGNNSASTMTIFGPAGTQNSSVSIRRLGGVM